MYPLALRLDSRDLYASSWGGLVATCKSYSVNTKARRWLHLVRMFRSRGEPDLIHFEPAGRRLTAARFFDSPGYPHVCVSWRGPAGGCSPHVVLGDEGIGLRSVLSTG